MERLRRATSIRPACAIVMILVPHAAVAGAEAGTAVGAGEVEGVVWVLAGYGTAGVTNAPVAGSRIDIAFEDGRVAGSSGCNSYAGTYALDGTALGIGPLASTRKASPPPLMQQEDQYQRILRAVDSATIAGDSVIVVIGSQAILGRYPDVPSELLVSADVDVYPRNHPDRAVLIEGSIGELSPFHETFGYYAQAVGEETATLPVGWKDRVVPVPTPAGTGLCLEPHDLVLSKPQGL